MTCLVTFISGDLITTQESTQPPQPQSVNEGRPRRSKSLFGNTKSLSGQRLRRQRYDEIKYKKHLKKNGKLVEAIDWLYDQGIVFDVLPNHDTVREIAEKNIKTQALACLTYLEHEPEQEFPSIWQLMFGLAGGGIGFLVAQLFDNDTTQETEEEEEDAQDPDEENNPQATEADDTVSVGPIEVPQEVFFIVAVVLGVALFIIALLILLAVFKINRNSKHIAAWANSWKTALRDYEEGAESDSEPNGNQS